MSYSTQTDLLEQISESELIQLTDDADAGTVDSDAVSRAIVDADAEIDGYCGSRYDVPFSSTPVMIRKISVDISIYNLYARRMGAPEDRKERYDNALRFLRDVGKGVISLGGDAPDIDDDAGPDISVVKSDRIFSSGRSSDGSSGSLDNY